MIFMILPLVVPFVVFIAVPLLVQWLSPEQRRDEHRLVLAVGCACYAISWFLPSPLIEGEDTQFSTHFVGGGFFTGFVWLYIVRQLGWKLSIPLEMLSLYALVSLLGVANELFELLVTQLGLVRLTPCDTWWDLFANTVGALTFWLLYRGGQLLRRSRRSEEA